MCYTSIRTRNDSVSRRIGLLNPRKLNQPMPTMLCSPMALEAQVIENAAISMLPELQAMRPFFSVSAALKKTGRIPTGKHQVLGSTAESFTPCSTRRMSTGAAVYEA